MNKFWLMGITLLLSFVVGFYIFMPGQYGHFWPNFSEIKVVQSIASTKSQVFPDKPALVTKDTGQPGHADNGRTVIKGELPPDLKKLSDKVAEMDAEIQEKIQGIQKSTSTDEGAKTAKIIQQGEALIAATNRKYGLDSSRISAVVASSPSITDPNLKQIESGLEAISKQMKDANIPYLQ